MSQASVERQGAGRREASTSVRNAAGRLARRIIPTAKRWTDQQLPPFYYGPNLTTAQNLTFLRLAPSAVGDRPKAVAVSVPA